MHAMRSSTLSARSASKREADVPRVYVFVCLRVHRIIAEPARKMFNTRKHAHISGVRVRFGCVEAGWLSVSSGTRRTRERASANELRDEPRR